jgi:acyl dehydratase
MRVFESAEQLQAEIGKEVAVSEWMTISQERVNQFAHATDDLQWIHVDVERAQRESPFGATIAHGYLTLALLPKFIEEQVAFGFGRMSINYGVNKVRFPSPLMVGAKARARFSLLSVEHLADCVQSVWSMTVEQEHAAKPVCVAEAVLRRY